MPGLAKAGIDFGPAQIFEAYRVAKKLAWSDEPESRSGSPHERQKPPHGGAAKSAGAPTLAAKHEDEPAPSAAAGEGRAVV